MYQDQGLDVLYVTDDGSTLLLCEASAPIHAEQIVQALNAWGEIKQQLTRIDTLTFELDVEDAHEHMYNVVRRLRDSSVKS